MALLQDYIAIGILQGVFEWLPVSSKTVVLLYALLVSHLSLLVSYLLGLFVQAGCVVSAALYYRRFLLRHDPFTYKFVAIATLSTIITGLPLYLFLLDVLEESSNPGAITLAIGLLLSILSFMHRSAQSKNISKRTARLSDAVYMGLAQGLAIVPGVSRSGITVLTLLGLGLSVEDSLRYSFISSIPVNLGAMVLVLLTQRDYVFNHLNTPGLLIALSISTIIGYITIDALTKTARRHGWKTTLIMALVAIIMGLWILIQR